MAVAESKETKKRSQDVNNPPPAKRSKSPGVHAVQGLIYDSEHGKTCHQCRHRIMYFMAACKNQKGDKLCTIKFCHKCLSNRYGEKAEDVALFDDWKCPKCRSICNCSVCMKKRGHKPTGILAHTAKATGFMSVSDMLDLDDPENSGLDMSVQNLGLLSKKPTSPMKEPDIVSPRKPGKENSFDGKTDVGLNLKNLTPTSANKKDDKAKRDGLKKFGNDNKGGGKEAKHKGLKEIGNSKKNNETCSTQIASQKSKVTMIVSKNVVECNWRDGCALSETISSKKRVLDDVSLCRATPIRQDEIEQDDGGKQQDDVFSNALKEYDAQVNPNVVKNLNRMKKNIETVPLPEGNILTTVAGIEFSPEDVGHVLQFLEFCEAFGKVLSVRKGQAEAILQELKTGQREGRGKHSLTVRFHTKLFSLMQEDMEKDENSWFEALKKFISESEYISKELSSVCDVKQYDQLDFSKKLKILNFLCDEVLCTIKLRSWIDDENSKCLQQEKKAKEKIVAAKSKEKALKNKLQDRIAKAIMAKKGAPLSNLEHEAIVSRIKSKADQAHAEMLEAMRAVPKRKQRSDAVRTEPILLDGEGRIFWKLTCFNDESNTLRQDMRSCSEDIPVETWLMFNPEQQESLEKYISFIRHMRKIIKHCDF